MRATAWAGVLLLGTLGLTGCGSSSACGWDLTSPEGRAANSARLTEANAWLLEHPGEPVPAPTSEFWHGDCPVDPNATHAPHEEGEGGDLGSDY